MTLRIAVVVLVAAAGFLIVRKHVAAGPAGEIIVSSDVTAFVRAGDDMLHGRDMYHDAGGAQTSYVYLPFTAFAAIPLLFLHPLAVDVLWYCLNVFLLFAVLARGYALFSGRKLSSLTLRARAGLTALSVLLAFRYLLRNAQDANINMVVLFLIVAGMEGEENSERAGREWRASLIGAAAAIKLLPLVFIFVFAARREWARAGWLLAGFGAATILPAAVMGVPATASALRECASYAERQFSPPGLEVENFSIWGTAGRVLSHQKAFEYPEGSPAFVDVAAFDLAALRPAIAVLNAALCWLVYWVARREFVRRKEGRAPYPGRSMLAGLLVMNLVSILLEDHHPVAFVLVYLFLLNEWRERRLGGLARWCVAGTGLASLLISYDVVVPLAGKYLYMVMLAYSLPVLPVALTLTALLLAGVRGPTAAPAATASRS